MDWIARQAGEELARFELGRVLFPRPLNRDLWRGGGPGDSVDVQTARILAAVGVAGLLALPLLMVASVLLHAPLAGPAAISLGYLGTARALASSDVRSAHFWSIAVSGGLVLWVLVVCGFGERPLSEAGLAGALLAAVFAAGPAILQRFPWAGEAKVGAATDGLPLRQPARPDRGGQVASATDPGDREEPTLPAAMDVSRVARGGGTPDACCDVGEAIAFALRHSGEKAAPRSIEFVAECAPDILAGCDQQVCRRILCTLIEAAVTRSCSGGTVRILGKRVKGAVLVRVISDTDMASEVETAKEWPSVSRSALRQIVEDCGGTVLFETCRGVGRASVRLPESKRDSLP